MSSRNKFIIGILVMLLVVLIIEYRMPRHFVWQPTFSHVDAQPFGCQVFDSVMKATMLMIAWQTVPSQFWLSRMKASQSVTVTISCNWHLRDMR